MKIYTALFVVSLLVMSCSPATRPTWSAEERGTPSLKQAKTSPVQEQYLEKTLRSLIDELNRVMAKPQEKEPGRTVYKVYSFSKEKLDAGDMTWTIVRDGSEEMRAAFTPGKEGEKPRIELNEYLVVRSKTTPSIALTIILHEMRHAYDYFTIGEKYKKYMENPLENFLYEMDSLFIEAVFARDYLAPKYKKLTPFEQYLLTSLEKDNLASVSLSFMAVDMDLTYYLHKRGKDLNNSLTCKDYLQEFVDQGKKLSKLSLNGKEFEKYSNLIRIQTYAVMTSPLIDNAFARNTKCKEDASRAAMVKEINEHIDKANAVVKEHAEFIAKFSKGVRKLYFGSGLDQKQ